MRNVRREKADKKKLMNWYNTILMFQSAMWENFYELVEMIARFMEKMCFKCGIQWSLLAIRLIKAWIIEKFRIYDPRMPTMIHKDENHWLERFLISTRFQRKKFKNLWDESSVQIGAIYENEWVIHLNVINWRENESSLNSIHKKRRNNKKTLTKTKRRKL
jgi:hypothetical protein